MRTSQWTLLLTALMFVASVWFVLASARTSGRGTAGAEEAMAPVASVRDLMTGIVSPASTAVYEAVSVVVDAKGETENYPKTEAEWNKVAGSAAAIAEAGALLMVRGRDGAKSTDPWRTMSKAMIDASLISRKAAEAHDKEALLASGEALNESCNACHRANDIP